MIIVIILFDLSFPILKNAKKQIRKLCLKYEIQVQNLRIYLRRTNRV